MKVAIDAPLTNAVMTCLDLSCNWAGVWWTCGLRLLRESCRERIRLGH